MQSGYTITSMGSLGGAYGVALDINSQGAVVGSSNTAQNLTSHAYFFNHGKLVDLGTLGGPNSVARGINDRGDIIGVSAISANSAQNDLFLRRGGHMTDLGASGSVGPFGSVKINNRGDIIGFKLGNGNAALDHRGRLIDLGSLAGMGSAERDLNNSGQVVGFSPVPGSSPTYVPDHAFLYSHGKMKDLGTLGGEFSVANDINQSGLVVGFAFNASGFYHAFLYNHSRMTDLGTLGGPDSVAAAVNSHGDVVGYSVISNQSPHGFLYKNGKMIDLNSLIPASSGFVVSNAEDINDRGQIIGEARSTNPQDHTNYIVMLNPTRSAR